MKNLLQTNDIVKLSWIQALLADSGVETVVLDVHTSVIEGSIGAIPRRLAVLEEDYERARRVLEVLSDPTSEPLDSAAGMKGALGAYPGARP